MFFHRSRMLVDSTTHQRGHLFLKMCRRAEPLLEHPQILTEILVRGKDSYCKQGMGLIKRESAIV